ncbi:Histidine biosynthesis bifunctional protein HisB [Carnimonas sp. R-84981]|uniref:imidazoleglycerol-phosphate dehydratase HisB n=1 Tax=Carnimonas bestiolae TaxID=3402172 RepID=UPI003EDB8368
MTDHATTHARTATVTRDTAETRIHIDLNLDGTGKLDVQTGVPFFEHMLDQVARHGQLDLAIQCDGDIEIDDHHTVEDIGIALGQAFREALGDKRGIQRYGHAYVPLDEALSRVVIDFSGRSGLYMNADFTRATVGRFDTQLVSEFFNGFVGHAAATLHIDNLKGDNAHHQVETIFKAFGRAVRQAISHDERMAGRIASTKGTL